MSISLSQNLFTIFSFSFCLLFVVTVAVLLVLVSLFNIQNM